ncbi:hypothetical protein THASP1DRAFT_29103 [Thamnocephalis sphaerospora]|uniref:Chitin-binding type-4 domain-containing protein n=1 Tax=Thamnocephalis sphaerospora TaxID=78915 RepID=A0A4P9XSJ3_9FUNG|nr:hypothetical protein THASP1DRAFT_29103 [Thamnocephalis sphaerospora]|eukprot:RKP09114.1 hypothetical protein THASP1DRAFT_29103 [Thamnocephalis sphaerospora]
MYMSVPPPRGYAEMEKSGSGDLYDKMMSPTHTICQSRPKGNVVATYEAGKSISVELTEPEGGEINRHSGGHCQFALSYDDKTFVVLKDVLQTCMLGPLKYTIPIPANAPAADRATFAWTWINAVGDRQYYMNCADVKIVNKNEGKDGNITGPKLLVVHLDNKEVFPEWNGEGTSKTSKKMDLFKKRPIIKVTASGSSNVAASISADQKTQDSTSDVEDDTTDTGDLENVDDFGDDEPSTKKPSSKKPKVEEPEEDADDEGSDPNSQQSEDSAEEED